MSSSKLLKPVKQALRFLPDRAYIQLYYFSKFRRLCSFTNPRTFNEKLQWLKLNYRISEDAALVDKHEVKDIVAARIGEEHVIPTLAVYDSAEEIDFDALPDAFVLKCTHDSEGVALVKDKSATDLEAVRAKLQAALAQNFYPIGREPHYRDLRPRIIAEPFLEDTTHGQLLDYKFFCFDGEVKALFIASDRSSGDVKFDYFDADYNPLDIRQSYPNSATPPAKPSRYDEMLSIARTLSQGHPHVRVDLYEVDGRVYFGELTFFHFSGFAPFHPPHWDRVWGDWLTLPAPANAA
nr:glycosyl transferase [Actinomycetota bacterium]